MSLIAHGFLHTIVRVNKQGASVSKTINRRYHEFREFDSVTAFFLFWDDRALPTSLDHLLCRTCADTQVEMW